MEMTASGFVADVDSLLNAQKQVADQRERLIERLQQEIVDRQESLSRLGVGNNAVPKFQQGPSILTADVSGPAPVLTPFEEKMRVKQTFAKASKASRACPVCGEKGHDGRRHRFDKKKPGKMKAGKTKRG